MSDAPSSSTNILNNQPDVDMTDAPPAPAVNFEGREIIDLDDADDIAIGGDDNDFRISDAWGIMKDLQGQQEKETQNDFQLALEKIQEEAMREANQRILDPLVRSKRSKPSKRVRDDDDDDDDDDHLYHSFEFDAAGDEDAVIFKREMHKFLQKEKQGKLGFLEDIEWSRIKNQERTRREKVKNDRIREAYEQEEELAREEDRSPNFDHIKKNFSLYHNDDASGLFVPLSSNLGNVRGSMQDLQMSDNEQTSPSPSSNRTGKAPKARKSPTEKRVSKVKKSTIKALAGTMQELDERDKRKTGKRAKTGGTRKGKSKASGKKAATEDDDEDESDFAVLGTAKSRKKKPQTANIGSLFKPTDVFNRSEHLAVGETDEGRLGMQKGRKDVALKNLIAGIPLDRQETAKVDSRHLLQASSKFDGTGACRSDDTGWKLKGMVSTLRHFQMLGASWCRERERDNDVKGGLIADDMGMGKTITMLANVVNGLPPKAFHGVRATLIICPSSLVDQWMSEVRKHCDLNHLGQVLRYNNPKPGLSMSLDDIGMLSSASIVISTHNAVVRSCPKITFPKHLVTQLDKEKWLFDNREKFRGQLHRIEWHRVVIDEAHVLKNHLSLTSLAMRELMAKHKWCITGTPIHNSPKELYPYFRFLGVKHTGDFRVFCHNYDTKSTTGQNRLLAQLNKIMLRRTYADSMLGEALVKLPRTSKTETWVTLNPVERQVYTVVRNRIIEQINSMVRTNANPAGGLSHCIFTMILRLRQITSHILLIEELMKDLLLPADIASLEKISQTYYNTVADQKTIDTILALRHALKSHEKWQKSTCEDEDDFQNELAAKESGLRTETIGGGYGLAYNFSELLSNLKKNSRWEEFHDTYKCIGCQKEKPDQARITTCGHMYCEPCAFGLLVKHAGQGGVIARCDECGVQFDRLETFNTKTLEVGSVDTTPFLNDDGSEPETEASSSQGKKPKKARRKKDRKAVPNYLAEEPLPSSKTLAVKCQILNWIEENPATKVIIFVQFLGMIEILKQLAAAEGWPTLQYHGSMTMEERTKVIDVFDSHPGPCIFIASLKCGGVGLNLTMASKVIMLEPWWNWAIEQQAFGRIFRIGQKQQTALLRVFAKDTIDERMYQMQEQKSAKIDAVMKNQGKNMAPSELLKLFGNIQSGDDGEYFVMCDETAPAKAPMFEDGAYLQWDTEK
ncbi:P-loop containing nucleoside triphosphate hydrolase protein [Microthyrium microscopicum]|uniref:P-loop containing nucleoside triphosphate hydrolase protein n=1 Tax=Microthyrium microscopicum TaxID=703497 RepID=A0A6A6UL09_9PEZI|nr:P-loop containing nucleoside triphosphate hydrolase protein [Microthyrium microscopicum]